MRASNFSRSLLFAVRPDWALWRPMGAFQPSLGAKKLGLALGAQIAFWALSTFKHFCSLKSTIESSFKHYWLENTTELKLNSEFRLKETFFACLWVISLTCFMFAPPMVHIPKVCLLRSLTSVSSKSLNKHFASWQCYICT